jgi:ribosomal protein S18 acetylase RimI-like enzyme
VHDEIEIVTLPVTEWRALKELRLRALQDSPQAFAQSYDGAAAYPDSLWQDRLREAASGASWLLVARHGETLVGMIGAFRAVSDEANGQATVYGTFVDPAARGQGIAGRLLAALLAQLATSGDVTTARLSVNAAQTAAVRLYERFGFMRVGDEVVTLGDGKPHRELILDKALP